jgi:hypothetical protein
MLQEEYQIKYRHMPLQIAIARAKSQFVIVFTGHCYAAASNNGYSSATVLTSLPTGDWLTTN